MACWTSALVGEVPLSKMTTALMMGGWIFVCSGIGPSAQAAEVKLMARRITPGAGCRARAFRRRLSKLYMTKRPSTAVAIIRGTVAVPVLAPEEEDPLAFAITQLQRLKRTRGLCCCLRLDIYIYDVDL